MGLLNLIFKQLGNTFKLIILVAKTAKMGLFKKTSLKKAKTSKSKSKTKSKGLKSTFLKNTKLISTKYKKLKSRFFGWPAPVNRTYLEESYCLVCHDCCSARFEWSISLVQSHLCNQSSFIYLGSRSPHTSRCAALSFCFALGVRRADRS